MERPAGPGVPPFEGCLEGRFVGKLAEYGYISRVTPVRPRGSQKGGKPMKRLYTVLCLILMLVLLVLPAVARADDETSAATGWTWDETTTTMVDGWTWDEM